MNVRQNAQVIVNAERYYRAMITRTNILEYSGSSYGSYLENLMEFHGAGAKALFWKQYHIGDELRICVMMEQ
jgi:hypothetical protein